MSIAHTRLFFSLGTLALGISLGACSRAADSTPQRDAEADSKTIAATLTEYIAAWKASDAARIGKLYTDDAVILPGDSPAASGVPAIVKFNQDFFDQDVPGSMEISSQETQILGDWAFNRGAYTYMAMPRKGGSPDSEVGKYLLIMKRQSDGSWKWYRDMDNSDAPPAPPPPATGKR